MLHHHRFKDRDLVCTDCQHKGYAVGHYDGYVCKDCRETLGSLRFDQEDIKNFKRKKTTRLVCQDCKSKLRCAACEVAFPRTAWTSEERKNYDRKDREKGTALVCKACRQAGYSPDDVATYKCQHCEKEGGWKAFDPGLIFHHKVHGNKKLLCTACAAKLAEMTKELQKKLKQSRRLCKCFCPVHKPKCPLEPCYDGDRRWPGSDGYISAKERQFLDNLNPQPEWWAKAWGRWGATANR